MNRIEALLQAMRSGTENFRLLMNEESCSPFTARERYGFSGPDAWDADSVRDGIQMEIAQIAAEEEQDPDPENMPVSRIASGDNLEYMLWLLKAKGMKGKIQLIYVDPPFFSNAKYQASVQIQGADGTKSPVLKVGAYDDKWGNDFEEYLRMLVVRFLVMKELLSDTGSLWVHLDWHGAHYVKMMLDEIFGHERFINEIAWTYKSGGAGRRSFSRKHDTLLFYSKTENYKFHPLREKSYNREGKPYRFKGVEEFEDEHGWYTMVNMKDVWSIDMVGRTSSERTGYATQKPEKLLERIIEACSDEGDLCADFFAGTGTMGAVCAEKKRPWIMCDEGEVAVAGQILRLCGHPGRFQVERKLRGQETLPKTGAEFELKDGILRPVRIRPDLSLVRQSDRETVTGFLNRDSVDLIHFWSVDPDYDGVVHEAERIIKGDEMYAEVPARGARRVHVTGYDLFGGRFEWEIQK